MIGRKLHDLEPVPTQLTGDGNQAIEGDRLGNKRIHAEVVGAAGFVAGVFAKIEELFDG